jgi:hypothetical protein
MLGSDPSGSDQRVDEFFDRLPSIARFQIRHNRIGRENVTQRHTADKVGRFRRTRPVNASVNSA